MCKIIYKDKNGKTITRNSREVVRMKRVSAVGVYESGIRRSERMSLKVSPDGAGSVRPFRLK